MDFFASNTLSQAGILIMAKFVILPLVFYWFQTNKLPKGIIAQMVHFRRNFIWKVPLRRFLLFKLEEGLLIQEGSGFGLENPARWNEAASS